MTVLRLLAAAIVAVLTVALCGVVKVFGLILFALGFVLQIAAFLLGSVGKLVGSLAMLVIAGVWIFSGYNPELLMYFITALGLATSRIWLELLASVCTNASAAL